MLDDEAIAELTAQMRQPEQRRADLRAQLAAGRGGARRLFELHDRIGVERRADRVRRGARLRRAPDARRASMRCDDGIRAATDVLEARRAATSRSCCGRPSTGDTLALDFTGSAAQHEGNLNCPLAVTRSACYFAVRVLTDPDIPASAGAYRPVDVIAARARCSTRARPAAVAAGNVETSSRVADVVLAAFGRALGQGTMNNLTLGNDEVVYYETIGGGQGACPDADGPSGVHVAMSNTLNTPVEALELEFPLRVVEYSLRRGSGGAGAHPGGDGVVRELEALEPLELLADHRAPAPPAAGGRRRRAGSPGATCSTARSCRRRRSAGSSPASDSGSRRRAAVVMGKRPDFSQNDKFAAPDRSSGKVERQSYGGVASREIQEFAATFGILVVFP